MKYGRDMADEESTRKWWRCGIDADPKVDDGEGQNVKWFRFRLKFLFTLIYIYTTHYLKSLLVACSCNLH